MPCQSVLDKISVNSCPFDCSLAASAELETAVLELAALDLSVAELAPPAQPAINNVLKVNKVSALKTFFFFMVGNPLFLFDISRIAKPYKLLLAEK